MGDPRDPSLDRSLTLVRDALARAGGEASPRPAAAGAGAASLATLVGAAFLAAGAALTGVWWLLVPAAGLGVLAALALGQRAGRGALTGGGTRAHIGMGADVAGDATVEPGAVVEMGATVGARAVVRAGAVVRMGATVQPGAVVEAGAVISWGATVGPDAVVGEGSVVGAGADVQARARVAPATTIWAGSTVHAGPAAAALPPPRVEDPRAARVRAVCDRLEAELAQASAPVREFLGNPGETVAALRRACEDLLRRERWLRAEAEPAALAELEGERQALTARLAQAADERVRASLRGALGALEEQLRQRQLLRTGADRLEAEQTRLLYTLEGLAAQVVRVRSAGAGLGDGGAGGLEHGVAQLREELEAIAASLEEVARPPPAALEPIAEVAGEEAPGVRPGLKER